MDNDPATVALAALDRALAQRPVKDKQDFSNAVRALAQLRDRLIARRRQQPGADWDDEILSQVNGILSIAMAGHFPIGAIPWSAVEQARELLATLFPPHPATTG